MMMRTRPALALSCAVAALVLQACGSDSPSSPSTTSTTISTPAIVSPASGAQIADASQPVTLVVSNATTTGKNALTYTFEVATDDQFATKVYSKAGVAQGTDGKTSVTLDKLSAGRGYYWHARADDSGGTGSSSWIAANFSVGVSSKLGAPVPIEPLAGADQGGAYPMLTIQNSTRNGATGAVTYTFEISDTSAFTTIVASGSQAENAAGQTKWFSTVSLSARTYYWRARGVESNGVASANSTAQPFKAVPDAIDLRTVSYTHGPDISSWPVTVTLTQVTQGLASFDEVCTYFTHQGEWPPVIFYNEPQTLVEGNQWYFANIGGRWYGVPGEWFRPGVACKYGQGADGIGYDSTQDEPMHSWVPRPGELVGYAVSTPARNYPAMKSLDERSQVILVPWK